jgi:hypothetical protein
MSSDSVAEILRQMDREDPSWVDELGSGALRRDAKWQLGCSVLSYTLSNSVPSP